MLLYALTFYHAMIIYFKSKIRGCAKFSINSEYVLHSSLCDTAILYEWKEGEKKKSFKGNCASFDLIHNLIIMCKKGM